MLVMSSSNCFNSGSEEDLFSDENIPLRNAPATTEFSENYAFSFNPDSPRPHTKATNSTETSVPETGIGLLNSPNMQEDDQNFKGGPSERSEPATTAQNPSQKKTSTNHDDSGGTVTKSLPPKTIRPILKTGLSQPILHLSRGNTIDDSFPFLGSVRRSIPLLGDNFVQTHNHHSYNNPDHEPGFDEYGQPLLSNELVESDVKFSSGHSLATIESGQAYDPYEQQQQQFHTPSFRISPSASSASGVLSKTHSFLSNRFSHPASPSSTSNLTSVDHALQSTAGLCRESSVPPLTTISATDYYGYNVPTTAIGSGVHTSMNRPLNAADLRSISGSCFTAEQIPSSNISQMTTEGDGFGAASIASNNRAIDPTAIACSAHGGLQPIRIPRIKSLIDRQLRKFASETSFAASPDTASDSSEHELTGGGGAVSSGARGRVFTVRTVPSNPSNRTNHIQDSGSGSGNACGSATVFSRLLRKRHESDDSAASMGSEATLASGSMTPLSRRKLRSSRMKRPKSATQMVASGHGFDYYGGGNYGDSQTSATIHSLHSLDSVQPLTATKEDRRTSNVYMMDDDSTHEFEEDTDEFENVTLMYAKHEKIPMKDFGSEIRATMDIDHLLNKSVLLLDLQETSLEEIFAKIIHEMDIQEPEFTSEQVRSVLFTQDAGNQFHILSRTVQSICTTGTIGGSFDYDQTWICALCMLNTVQHRHVAIARLSHPTNLGRTMQDLRFIIIVIAPSRAKGTKTALETTRTFATLFADMDIRQRLVMAQTVDQFRSTLLQAAKELAVDQNQWRERKTSIHLSQAKEQLFGPGRWYPFRGLKEDFCRRIKFYASDYLDGIRGPKTIQKLFSSIVFLYFACLLPAIAFGVLNDDNTNGGINVRKVIFAQAIGGIFFAIFGGQPVIILLTTVPLAIYIKVIYKISQELGYDFFAMYACVGLWCQFFLIVYASTEMCSLMKLATRSAEEMFSLFIAIAFTVESIRAIHTSFKNNYHNCDEDPRRRKNADEAGIGLRLNGSTFTSLVDNMTGASDKLQTTFGKPCHRDTSILYMLLMFGTLWLGLFLYNFRKTPYLTRSRREWLADYALPASVLIMSFTGAYCFSDIEKDKFKMRDEMALLAVANIFSLPWQGYFVCLLLGFSLSFLFFMDQNITSAIVNNPQNKLRKGSAQNLDLFVVAILNCFLSIMGLPWIHGALPHSPLHLRALADVEERLLQGHVHEVIMNVRETRLATLIAHTLILISTYTLLPYPLRWIPTSVLHGLFLYMALTSLAGNEMFERLLLLITEQQAYPPTHYIRKVPQRKVHLFTACQLIQLVLLCAFGFSPYPFIEMVFPIVCFFFLPIRHTLIPRLIDYKYLDALDGRH